VGISKQAVNKYQHRLETETLRLLGLIPLAEQLREAHPGCGVEKMYDLINPDFIGRDKFIEFMMDAGFRLKRPCNGQRTTVSGKVVYANLIKGMIVSAPSTIWQSDITYFRIGERWYYGVFIIDVYTKIIVGYKVSDSMRATANYEALAMALRLFPAPRIHHSDRGSQYSCLKYTGKLKANGCLISMSLTAQDNAYAERINQTIKYEYLNYWKPKTFEALKRSVKKAVNNYNQVRPHNNLNRMSPNSYYEQCKNDPKNMKPITIFDNTIT